MSLHCPFEDCTRTFARQQALSQHIKQRHCFEENELDISENDKSGLFQDKELFEDSDLFEVSLK